MNSLRNRIRNTLLGRWRGYVYSVPPRISDLAIQLTGGPDFAHAVRKFIPRLSITEELVKLHATEQLAPEAIILNLSIKPLSDLWLDILAAYRPERNDLFSRKPLPAAIYRITQLAFEVTLACKPNLLTVNGKVFKLDRGVNKLVFPVLRDPEFIWDPPKIEALTVERRFEALTFGLSYSDANLPDQLPDDIVQAIKSMVQRGDYQRELT